MKILIIEDQFKLNSYIKKTLVDNGHWVEQAYDGYTGRSLALTNYYDVIILDVVLPEINGIQICKDIRSKKIKVPIILISALTHIEDKVKGFESGADDFVTKPFDMIELMLRVNAMYNRCNLLMGLGPILSVADLEMNLESKVVKRADKVIGLTVKEFSLLEYLLKNKGKTISKSELAEKVWDIKFDRRTNLVEVYVNFVRKKIDKNFEPKLLKTITGMGYVLKDARE